MLAGTAAGVEADSAAMVRARVRSMRHGRFEPLTRAVVDAAREHAAAGSGCVVDVGGGTGHHLAAVLDAWPDAEGIVLDLSRDAARVAARAHPRMSAVVCDVRRRLPVRDGGASLVLNVFAPRAGAEMRRVLAPGGQLLVVTPTRRHLVELAGVPGMLRVDERKQERLERSLAGQFVMARQLGVEWQMMLDRDALRDLVLMGPSAHHVAIANLDASLASLPDPMTVTGSVELSAWSPG